MWVHIFHLSTLHRFYLLFKIRSFPSLPLLLSFASEENMLNPLVFFRSRLKDRFLCQKQFKVLDFFAATFISALFVTKMNMVCGFSLSACEVVDLEPTMPLPDTKLLLFILDRLQKYGMEIWNFPTCSLPSLLFLHFCISYSCLFQERYLWSVLRTRRS